MKFLAKKHQKLVRDFISKTDWESFWKRVMDKASPEIEAYRLARMKSRYK